MMITKQQIRINSVEKNSIQSDAKKIKYYHISRKLLKLSANFLAMCTKQKIRINQIEEISIKSGEKKVKYYMISKKLLEAFSQFSDDDHKTTNQN